MKKEKILLSVVVPIYKVEKYLCKCLDSLVSQPLENVEIILVDDGSPDKSPQICDDYACRYNNIIVIHKPNGGVVSARKEGAKRSQGKYITFVDGDDWIERDYLRKICEMASEYSPDIIAITKHFRKSDNKEATIYKECDRTGLYDRKKMETEVFGNLLYTSPFFTFGMTPALWSKVIRRQMLVDIIMDEPENICMGEDLAVTLPCMLKADSVYYSDICGYYYRQNPTSMTHTFDVMAPQRVNSLLNYVGEKVCYDDKYDIKTQLTIYAIYIVNITVISLIMNSKDMRTDLDNLDVLWGNAYVKQGLKNSLPIRVQTLMFATQTKKVWFLKLLRRYWLIKSGDKDE